MKRRIALSFFGKDRPGIVARVSRILYEQHCNIEDSSMTILAGEFAMILIISLAKDTSPEALKQALESCQRELNLTFSFRQLSSEEGRAVKINQEVIFLVTIHGADRPGIVYKVSQYLSERQINIVDLETKIKEPESAKPLYIMFIEVNLPAGTEIESVIPGLNAIAAELGVSIQVKPVDSLIL